MCSRGAARACVRAAALGFGWERVTQLERVSWQYLALPDHPVRGESRSDDIDQNQLEENVSPAASRKARTGQTARSTHASTTATMSDAGVTVTKDVLRYASLSRARSTPTFGGTRCSLILLASATRRVHAGGQAQEECIAVLLVHACRLAQAPRTSAGPCEKFRASKQTKKAC